MELVVGRESLRCAGDVRKCGYGWIWSGRAGEWVDFGVFLLHILVFQRFVSGRVMVHYSSVSGLWLFGLCSSFGVGVELGLDLGRLLLWSVFRARLCSRGGGGRLLIVFSLPPLSCSGVIRGLAGPVARGILVFNGRTINQ